MQAAQALPAVLDVLLADSQVPDHLVAMHVQRDSFRGTVLQRARPVPLGNLPNRQAILLVLDVKQGDSKTAAGKVLVHNAQQDDFKGVVGKRVALLHHKDATLVQVQRALHHARQASIRQEQELKIVIAMGTATRDDFVREPVIHPPTVLFAQLDDTDELVRAVANVLLHVMQVFIVLLERERMIKNAVVL